MSRENQSPVQMLCEATRSLRSLCNSGDWLRKTVDLLCRTVAIVIAASIAQTASAETQVDYQRDIRPILSDKCFKCHGPDEQTREADLRLDRDSDADHIFSREDPNESELIRRITTEDADELMPPPKSKLALTPKEIATVKKWVEQGSAYSTHWSFAPIQRPEPPSSKFDTQAINEIDRFVFYQLEQNGLQPQSSAHRERLIRRLAFDLTGLPPTLKQIDEYLADDSSDAYEKVVDQFLASEAFGERLASDWLDVARYSDTYGYQVDRDRYVWPWRDWVIKAINNNLPYDEFITWQLAGDLLPNPSRDQLVATTFNRLHPQKVEGGSVPEEFRVEYVADRNHTFATAFLGLTLECCRCHDHKYDPLSQKEYYQLFAFFNTIDESGLYSYFTESVPTPTTLLTSQDQDLMAEKLEAEIVLAEQKRNAIREQSRSEFENWLQIPQVESITPGQVAYLNFDDYSGANELVEGQPIGGQPTKAVKLTGDDAIDLGVGNFPRQSPFSVSLWMNTPDVKERAVVFHRSRAWTDAASRGYQLLLEDGKLSFSLIHFWPGNAIRVKTINQIATQTWLHVLVTYDGSSRADGLRLFLDGKPAELETVRDHLYKNITGGGGDNIAIGQRFRDRGFKNGLVDEFRVFDRQLTEIEAAQVFDGHSLQDLLRANLSRLDAQTKSRLFDYYLSTQDAAYRAALADLKAARERRNQLTDGVQEIMVMAEMDRPRTTHILKRGAYDAPGDEVRAETPSVLPPIPAGVENNRLGLAKWLTDPSHPLTARVAVNRFWQICFGNGLVRTPEDFGSQGMLPTHPELLDWLAFDFIDCGWDVKRLMKKMVMSATYRQRSEFSAELREKDPNNLLLARAPRYRLAAEMIRDNGLASSELLVQKIGGPSAKPYELTVSFKPSGQDKGDGLYRRSLYTFWQRTAPAPVMMALDASKRDVCTVKRERTASPLQAFVLMNDPQFVEAARILAERMVEKHGDERSTMITEMYRRLTGRGPFDRELKMLSKFMIEQERYYTQEKEAAVELLKTGQKPRNEKLDPAKVAAVTIVANTIMNLDECVMKR